MNCISGRCNIKQYVTRGCASSLQSLIVLQKRGPINSGTNWGLIVWWWQKPNDKRHQRSTVEIINNNKPFFAKNY